MKGILKGIGFFLLYFVLSMLLQTISSVAFMAVSAANGIREEEAIVAFTNNNLLGIIVITDILLAAVMFLIFKLRKADIKTEWKLQGFKLKDTLLPIITAFSYSLIYALLTYNAPSENMIQSSVRYYSDISPLLGAALMVLNLLIAAPVCEELVLRGIVYTRIEKTTNPITAVIVSSLLFGIMHIAAGGITLTLGAVVMGAVFSLIFCKKGSLYICFIAHAAANLPDFLLYDHPNLSGTVMTILYITFGALLITGLFLMLKKSKTDN